MSNSVVLATVHFSFVYFSDDIFSGYMLGWDALFWNYQYGIQSYMQSPSVILNLAHPLIWGLIGHLWTITLVCCSSEDKITFTSSSSSNFKCILYPAFAAIVSKKSTIQLGRMSQNTISENVKMTHEKLRQYFWKHILWTVLGA